MHKKLPLSLLACLVTAAPVMAATPAYNDGVAFYHAGKYHQAAVALSRAAIQEPNSALAHYYLANALVHVGSHAQATKEYRTSLLLDPYGSVSAFCRAALHGYNEPIPTPQESIAAADTVSNTIPIGPSSGVMKRQLDLEKRRNETISKGNAAFANVRSQYDDAKIDAWMHEQIELLHSNPNRPAPIGSIQDQEYIARKEAEIKAQAKEEHERIKREASDTANRYRRVADERQQLLDQAAHDLEAQMAENGSKSGVRLLAQGTDLYVRRYASVPMHRHTPDAHSAVVRIYGRGANAEANPNSPQLDSTTTDTHAREVRGKVLN